MLTSVFKVAHTSLSGHQKTGYPRGISTLLFPAQEVPAGRSLHRCRQEDRTDRGKQQERLPQTYCGSLLRHSGKTGIQTLGTDKPFTGFRVRPIRSLWHLSFNRGAKVTSFSIRCIVIPHFFYLPRTIFLISLSLFNASMGVRWSTSRSKIASRT